MKRHPGSDSMLQDLLKELDQCRIIEKQKVICCCYFVIIGLTPVRLGGPILMSNVFFLEASI